MQAKDIMTAKVETVSPTTSVQDAAQLMVDKRVSGLPVVSSDGALLGIVSEGDLLHRGELGTERKRSFWLRIFTDSDELASEYAKSHGRTVDDIMTRHVVAVRENAELREVADVLERHRVKRVPVTDGGKLKGIITRGDLVRAFTMSRAPSGAATSLSDADIQKAIIDKMRGLDWLEASYVNVIVSGGKAELWRVVTSPEQHKALRVLAAEVPGVTAVDDRIQVRRHISAAS